MGVPLISLVRTVFLLLAITGPCFAALSFAEAEVQAPPPRFSRPQAQIVRADPENNQSLCTIIGGDQTGRPIQNTGLRPVDLRLFAESDPGNARLAALYQRTAKLRKLGEHETRLIGYGDCNQMQELATAMNLSYYNIPELNCAGQDGLIYRVRPLGNRFKLDIMNLADEGRSLVTLDRENIDITDTSTDRFGCVYRVTIPEPKKAQKFKMCLMSLDANPRGQVRMEFGGRKVPHALTCEADRDFAKHALPLVHKQPSYDTNLPPPPSQRAAAPVTYAPAYQ